jgi:hypothetical protein
MNPQAMKKFEMDHSTQWLSAPSLMIKDFQHVLKQSFGIVVSQKQAKDILKMTSVSFVYRLIAMAGLQNKMLNL